MSQQSIEPTGNDGITADEVFLLGQLMHYNPRAWLAIREEVGNKRFRAVYELAADKVLVIYGDHKHFTTRAMLCLNTCKITDRS